MANRRSSRAPDTVDRPVSSRFVSAAQILDLWKRGSARLSASRKRVLLCSDIRRNKLAVRISDAWIGSDEARSAAADWLEVALPERQMFDLNLGNPLEAGEPTFERIPLGETDTAVKDGDLLEVWSNSAREEIVPWEVAVAKGREDGEYAGLLLPDTAAWNGCPSYLDEKTGKPDGRYDRDGRDRPSDDTAYSKRNEPSSRKAYDDERLAYIAEHPPFVARIIPALDCAPIFETGRGRRRWELSALVVRTLFERETLLKKGYRWIGRDRKQEAAQLVQRGYGADLVGKAEQVYLYELYATEWDEKTKTLHPFVAYTVAGCGTWQTQSAYGTTSGSNNDDESVAVIDLYERYGIDRPLWGYYYGMHFEDDDPDHRGMPALYPLVGTILNVEGLLLAHNAHTHEYAFGGEYHTPDPSLAKENAALLLDGQGNLLTPRRPRSGEIVTATGEVRPAAQNPASPDAGYMENVFLRSLRDNAPDPSQAGGGGASSGHELVVSNGLLRTAKRQIREGGRQFVEDCGEWMLRVACALIRKEQAEVAVFAITEATVGDDGEERRRKQALLLKDRWVGVNYRLRAIFGEEATLADKSLIASEYEAGRASWDRYCKAFNISSPETERTKIVGDKFIMQSEMFQMRIQAAWLRRRGEEEAAQEIEAQLAGQMTPGGNPAALLPSRPGPEQVPGIRVPNMAQNVRAGVVSGEMGIAARQADGAALAAIAPPGGAG